MAIFCIDLKIDQGTDFSFTTLPWVIDGAVQDLTGRTCRFAVFAHPYDVAPMLVVTNTPTSKGSTISNGVLGSATVTLANVATAALLSTIGPLRYDWFIDVADPVTSVTVTDGGTGYTSAPAVSFTGGSGSNAAATASISGGAVVGVTMTDIGYGYTGTPAVVFTGGAGSDAAATAVVGADITELLQTGKIFLNATLASA